MNAAFEIRNIPLTSRRRMQPAEALLQSQGLQLDSLDELYGIYDTEDTLHGVGGFAGTVLKCLALSDALQGTDIGASIVSHLCSRIAALHPGMPIQIFTKPIYKPLFSSLGFNVIGQAPYAVMLENQPAAFRSYLDLLHRNSCDGSAVIVMNANPCTLGHLHLVQTAAKRFPHLFVMLVDDANSSQFSYMERYTALFEAIIHLSNVSVLPASRYAVSAATFPSYFLKQDNDPALQQIKLDLNIFTHHIAPALKAVARVVGTEPSDPLTARYNAVMKETLPGCGIQVMEIERLQIDGCPVSASAVREAVKQGRYATAFRLTPPSTAALLMSKGAETALMQELQLTPKPGLVDTADSGAHKDMDFNLMLRSIQAISPFFCRMAKAPDAHTLQRIGIECEQAMMKATGGVNTHRGAIFAIGLTINAALRTLQRNGCIQAPALQKEIQNTAAQISPISNEKGAQAIRKYGIKGALANALEGYSLVFGPLLSALKQGASPLRVLLLSMSQLEDSNIYHRGGPEAAFYLRTRASELLTEPDDEKLSLKCATLNSELIRRNLSPGGSADMLSLTIFINNLLINDKS